MDFFHLFVIFIATMIAGAINAVAGGGTVFSFSAMVWAGLPTVVANATNATALVPGSIGSVIAYWRDLVPQWRRMLVLLIPTISGSLLGAFTVANTSESIFRRVVPFLILFAISVFAARNFFTNFSKRAVAAAAANVAANAKANAGAKAESISTGGYALGIFLQFIISFYGGYFGAGIGILMLTSLSVIGMSDIHRMNALKTLLATAINGTAMIFFISAGKVDWQVVPVAAVGALIGGYLLARLAKKVDQQTIRIGVIVAGLIVSAWMFVRLYLS